MDQATLDWFLTSPGADTKAPEEPGPDTTSLVADLAAAPPGRRAGPLADYLCEEIGRVLRRPAGTVDRDQTMTALGVGSMGGLELRGRIEATLGVAPELTGILRAGSVGELAALVEDVLA